MCEVLIFGGTTEGRVLAEFCNENKISAYLSVTTKYGADLICKSDFLHVIVGKMSCSEMLDFMNGNGIKIAADATHPYAAEATANINQACNMAKIKYIRIVREKSEIMSNCRYFDDFDSLIAYINNNDGNILITVGSKELYRFCSVNNFRKRCTVRVLFSEKIIEECMSLGFDRTHIIAEQGPFSLNKNIEHINRAEAFFLVTKDSGRVGGLYEKAYAAEKCGAELLIIKRPEENGIDLEEAKKILLLWRK